MVTDTRINAELDRRYELPKPGLVLHTGRSSSANGSPFGAYGDVLARTIDALGLACALYDSNGQRVHVTPRLWTLLSNEPEMDVLERVMAHLARGLASSQQQRAELRCPHPSAMPREVRTVCNRWQLEVTNVGFTLPGAQAMILVRVTADEEPLPPAHELAERYGFTPREGEVARLIAQGFGTMVIAERLRLSPHTVRRHTERVFSKLGVHTRAAVAARLQAG